jgi:hypothetical protein
MAIAQLSEAVSALVRDGDVAALEGFTQLIPNAARHELIRLRQTEPPTDAELTALRSLRTRSAA